VVAEVGSGDLVGAGDVLRIVQRREIAWPDLPRPQVIEAVAEQPVVPVARGGGGVDHRGGVEPQVLQRHRKVLPARGVDVGLDAAKQAREAKDTAGDLVVCRVVEPDAIYLED
jgi:hypothetical protein